MIILNKLGTKTMNAYLSFEIRLSFLDLFLHQSAMTNRYCRKHMWSNPSTPRIQIPPKKIEEEDRFVEDYQDYNFFWESVPKSITSVDQNPQKYSHVLLKRTHSEQTHATSWFEMVM